MNHLSTIYDMNTSKHFDIKCCTNRHIRYNNIYIFGIFDVLCFNDYTRFIGKY